MTDPDRALEGGLHLRLSRPDDVEAFRRVWFGAEVSVEEFELV